LIKKIYVGNLPFSATDADVRKLFEEHGTVESVNVIMDRDTGRARGFGFVEMEEAGAIKAMQVLDGRDFDGRDLKVNEARARRAEGGANGGGRSRY
jgi:RNA recognition motif-containing protein